ncbi:hypothetical protein [Domibacillus aminovorans]|nr:hypothetical protein [Domibacillus aminovorans]
MAKFIDDLAGAIFDIIKSFCYLIAGVLIVGVPFVIMTKFFELISSIFF